MNFVSPAAGVTARYTVGGFELIAMARREPVPLTAEVLSGMAKGDPTGVFIHNAIWSTALCGGGITPDGVTRSG